MWLRKLRVSPRCAHAYEFAFEASDLRALRTADGLLSTEAPRALAEEMHRAWVEFVKTGHSGWSGHRIFQ